MLWPSAVKYGVVVEAATVNASVAPEAGTVTDEVAVSSLADP